MVNTTLQVIDDIKPGAGAELLADIGLALAEEE